MSLLAGKVALVTGAAQGLGLATTRLLLKHRAKASTCLPAGAAIATSCCVRRAHDCPAWLQVGVLDFSRAQLDSTWRELKEEYGEGKVLRLLCDVTDHDKLVNPNSSCLLACISCLLTPFCTTLFHSTHSFTVISS